MENIKNMQFSDQNFQGEVEQASGLVVVDFWAPWCGPCRMMAPIIDELAEEMKNDNRLKVGKLNVDENQGMAEKYGIMSIPALIIFKNGKIVEQLTGFRSKEEIKDLIQKHI